MIRQELEQLSVNPRDLRKFGLLVGGVFLLLGAWFLFRDKPFWPYVVAPGVPLVILGLIAPRTLKHVYRCWMGMAFVLGTAVSTLILSLFYFVVVTPIGLLGRLCGKDFLSEKIDPQAASYWSMRGRSPNSQAEFERQF